MSASWDGHGGHLFMLLTKSRKAWLKVTCECKVNCYNCFPHVRHRFLSHDIISQQLLGGL